MLKNRKNTVRMYHIYEKKVTLPTNNKTRHYGEQ